MCAVHCPPPSLVTHRLFKHFSKSSFEDDLSCVPWSILDVFGDLDYKVEAFNLLFTDVLDYHASLKTIRVRKHSNRGSTRPSVKRWTDKIGSSDSIATIQQLELGTSSRPIGIVLFGFKEG